MSGNEKTLVSKKAVKKSSESSDTLTPLIPERWESDIVDRARAMEFFAKGAPGVNK